MSILAPSNSLANLVAANLCQVESGRGRVLRNRSICGLVSWIFLTWGLCAFGVQEPLVWYPLNGNLTGQTSSGGAVVGNVIRGDRADVQYIDAPQGKRGLYLGEQVAVALPVENFNPPEGTISLWFRPDWSPPSGKTGMIVELAASPAYQFTWRKGYLHVPDNCYLDITGCGALNIGAYNLFTARTWRHYAVRWSAKRRSFDVAIDGGLGDRPSLWSAGFKCSATSRVKAELMLNGNIRGAFADVKVFDHWLDGASLLQLAGRTRPTADYLQRQTLPRGATGKEIELAYSSYVDPITGRKTAPPVSKQNQADVRVYNPANMPDLPETPHTKWAKPLAGGPIRALMVFPTDFYDSSGSLLREAVEVWQRLDVQCDVANRPTPAVMNKDYDVFVISHQDAIGGWRGWTDLDANFRQRILTQVKSGRSGLVFAYPTKLDGDIQAIFDPKRRIASDRVLRGFPTAAMNRASVDAHESVYNLNDGFFETEANLSRNVVEVYGADGPRAVKLNYFVTEGWTACPGITPDYANNCAVTDAHYDYWMALAVRAILYAAGREPTTTIRSANVDGAAWTVTTEGSAATLEYRARDIWGRQYARGQLRLQSPGTTTIQAMKLPPRAVVEFQLKDSSNKILDWYCAAVPPAADAKIAEVKLDKDCYSKGDSVSGTVRVAVKDAGPYRIVVYLADHELRRLVRQEIPVQLTAATPKDVPFALTIPTSSDSLLMRVNALLYKDGSILDDRSADCPVPRRAFDGFWSVGYGAKCNRQATRFMTKQFRDLYGVNIGVHNTPHNSALMARDNLASFEYMTHLGYPSIGSDYDMTSREHWEDFFPKNLFYDPKKILPFRPLFWSLGEEHCVAGIIPSPTADAKFREYLKRKYGSLERLNEIWKSAYASWDAVKVPNVKDPPDNLKPRQEGTREFELQRFAEHAFADRHAYLAKYFPKLDPGGEVGIHVGWELWTGRGYDYWLLSQAMDAMIGYEGAQDQYIRSFFKHYYGSFYHYRVGLHEESRWYPWQQLANGSHGTAYYAMTSEVIFGAFTNDLHLGGDFAAGAAEYKAVGEIGQLLARSDYQQDQVAIHYSQDSFHAGVGAALSYIHESFVNLLFDAGVPFRFVSYQQLADGELTKSPYRALILPHSISLSPEEAKAIRAYVNRGGTVWADVLPGTHDNFARALPQSSLADLFANLKEVRLPGGKTLKLNGVGNGTVVLGDVGNYMYARNVGNHLAAQQMLDTVIEAAKVHRSARVVDSRTGQLANGVWTSGYGKGGHRYVVAVKDHRLADRDAIDARIELGAKGHVYEMRSQKYLGETDRVNARLEPTCGQVFSILPYRVVDLSAKPAAEAVRGRDLPVHVRFDTTAPVGPDDQHVIRVSALRPDGREETSLRRLMVVRAGQGELCLPIAYDDAEGTWTIVLHDIATGIQRRVPYTVK